MRVETVLESDADSVIDEEVKTTSLVVDPETKSWISGPSSVEQQLFSAKQLMSALQLNMLMCTPLIQVRERNEWHARC